jgi:transposase-like protein
MDNRYRSPWQCPPCPSCGSHLWVDASTTETESWLCHKCDRHFSECPFEPADPPEPYPIPHPHAGGGSESFND